MRTHSKPCRAEFYFPLYAEMAVFYLCKGLFWHLHPDCDYVTAALWTHKSVHVN